MSFSYACLYRCYLYHSFIWVFCLLVKFKFADISASNTEKLEEETYRFWEPGWTLSQCLIRWLSKIISTVIMQSFDLVLSRMKIYCFFKLNLSHLLWTQYYLQYHLIHLSLFTQKCFQIYHLVSGLLLLSVRMIGKFCWVKTLLKLTGVKIFIWLIKLGGGIKQVLEEYKEHLPSIFHRQTGKTGWFEERIEK